MLQTLKSSFWRAVHCPMPAKRCKVSAILGLLSKAFGEWSNHYSGNNQFSHGDSPSGKDWRFFQHPFRSSVWRAVHCPMPAKRLGLFGGYSPKHSECGATITPKIIKSVLGFTFWDGLEITALPQAELLES